MWLHLLAAHAADPSYVLSFPDRAGHMLQVEATLDATGDSTELMMATWTPGSYLIREYTRNVEGIEAKASDGSPLTVRKSKKNRWVVETAGAKSFQLSYGVYCREMSVRDNFVDEEMAVLNGAPTFIVPVDLKGPYDIEVQRPSTWSRTVSSLAPDGLDDFSAKTYDELVDSPILVGNPAVTGFEVDGVEHVLVDIPDVDPWDSQKAADAIADIAKELKALWGSFPYERYHYFNVLGEGRGGLEHSSNTLMLTSRKNTLDDEAFDKWLGLVAHEQFHAWNVKRLRPAPLGPFDYENEVYTESLWIAEGFTAYYDDLILVRAGLIDPDAYLLRMSKNLAKLHKTPGRLEQPLSRASYDAWIKHYRADENSPNTAVSYYIKGALVAWMLDARIRTRTRGKKSLDDAIRLAYARYSGEAGYTPEQFEKVLSEVAGEDLTPFLDDAVRSATELDYTEALATFGLKLSGLEPTSDAWLGVTWSKRSVATVRRDGPAWKKLNAGDEVLAIDDNRFDTESKSLAGRMPGQEVQVLISRRGRIETLTLTLGAAPGKPVVTRDPAAKKRAITQREAWLGSP